MRKTFEINYEWDIVHIRSEARELSREVGFDELDQARIVQSISELARNVVQYADKGIITIATVEEEDRKGIKIQVQDTGPGIPNLEELAKGKNQNLGETSGLQQVYMLMDELKQIPVENGTCVEAVKWLKSSRMLHEK
ncbi:MULTISPECIES: ATP-binding protein [Thermoactinomyces]|jgi:serine/threonine-protein kinase RsbT|uniref:ATP-binding protein n=1 Tax=Thermoactinomyces daqus TaxID=1329516 RepID=A0A7W1XB09_9BACL|nr:MULTISPECIES: ATP-binding protein [Thermoactinomyces]MBA4543378.1 ATP-binding protein [Thermoactinomyces daqus]MBH8599468.1 ATP-binding protein [Thermoactinomyces sp. CICC 10523]MBH8605256.1 ATP-binding protein [Thermoactinomyces sp. CICC 10522]MBH8608161.1 ATP-binding protein [Thermoactinomyces sp. CICC 10521]